MARQLRGRAIRSMSTRFMCKRQLESSPSTSISTTCRRRAKVGRLEVSRDLLILEWNNVVLYPASYFARQIPVQASITLPADWQFASALERHLLLDRGRCFSKSASRHSSTVPCMQDGIRRGLIWDTRGVCAVHLDLFADRPEAARGETRTVASLRSLVQQGVQALRCSPLRTLRLPLFVSDQVEQNGLEHHQSSEDGNRSHVLH